MLVLAHAGHWLVSALYVAPVLVVVGFIRFQSWKDARRDGAEDAPERPGDAV